MDFASTAEVDNYYVEHIDILNELHNISEIKNLLALFELAEEVRPREMGVLLDC